MTFFAFTNLSNLDLVFGQLLTGTALGNAFTPGPALVFTHPNTSPNTAGSEVLPPGTTAKKFAWVLAFRNDAPKLSLLSVVDAADIGKAEITSVSAVLTWKNGKYELDVAAG
jgi:hypothetical protein